MSSPSPPAFCFFSLKTAPDLESSGIDSNFLSYFLSNSFALADSTSFLLALIVA
jgi:hypothetical protein